MTNDDTPEVRVPVPTGYSDEESDAFRAGFRTCAQLFGQAAATYEQLTASKQDDDGDSGNEDDGVCPECGAGLLSSMGASESVTPAGWVCPECDL